MSAPVTEAHLELARTIRTMFANPYRPSSDAAQIIAESEAKAVAGVNASLDAAIIRAWGISAERDQLRAEVERLKKQIKDDNRSYGCELRDPYGTIWEQATKDHDRAGKAERALAELREWQAGVIANERLHHAERKEAIARAERAEAELAKAKAVLASIEEDGTEEHNAAVRLRQELADERARSKQYRECWCNQCGKIIAAMKEETK